MLPKTSTYVKSYDEQIKWMYFLIEDHNLLEKYNTIWDKVSTDIKRNLLANLSIIKKSHDHEVTDFYDKDIPKVDFNHPCLAVIS